MDQNGSVSPSNQSGTIVVCRKIYFPDDTSGEVPEKAYREVSASLTEQNIENQEKEAFGASCEIAPL